MNHQHKVIRQSGNLVHPKPMKTPLKIRRADDRFHSNHGWLNAYHSFSFAGHDHPDHRGYQSLRVINQDTIAPGQGFGTHPHHSMEIFTYIISGELHHQDSMGNGRTIRAGEFQYMSAGSGVEHSEFNPSPETPTELLQIWILPNLRGGNPRYQDFDLPSHTAGRALTPVASPDGREGSIEIRANATVHYGHLDTGSSLEARAEIQSSWLQLITGSIEIGGEKITPGDGVGIDGSLPEIMALRESTFFLFSF